MLPISFKIKTVSTLEDNSTHLSLPSNQINLRGSGININQSSLIAKDSEQAEEQEEYVTIKHTIKGNASGKVVLLGDTSVGKTCIVVRMTRNEFSQHSESTIGAAFRIHSYQVTKDLTVRFEIWDTAGQKRYHALASMYYRGAYAILVVYDISKKESFFRAHRWVKEVQEKAIGYDKILLIGNKLDRAE
eukprot:370334_1